MRHAGTAIRIRAALFLALLLALASGASAKCEPTEPPLAEADLYKKVVRSLVFIEAKGIAEEDDQTVEVAAESNGFLTSDDGFVLTNYHLLKKLGQRGKVHEVKFTVRIGSKHAEARPAKISHDDRLNDLLQLKVQDVASLSVAPQPVRFLAPATLESMRSTSTIFSASIYSVSFKKSIGDYERDKGHVTSTDEGQSGKLWVSNMRYDEGESGSPIFLANGRVIGIVKGEDNNTTAGLFIPIVHARNIEPAVQAEELNCQITGLKGDVDARIEALSKALQALQKSKPELPQAEFQKLELASFADKFGLSRQLLAQATCTALAPQSHHSVNFAVGRRCVEKEKANCNQICKESLKKSVHAGAADPSKLACFDSIHVYGTSASGSPADENNALGLKTSRYNSCTIDGCGPNFCCCGILLKAVETPKDTAGAGKKTTIR